MLQMWLTIMLAFLTMINTLAWTAVIIVSSTCSVTEPYVISGFIVVIACAIHLVCMACLTNRMIKRIPHGIFIHMGMWLFIGLVFAWTVLFQSQSDCAQATFLLEFGMLVIDTLLGLVMPIGFWIVCKMGHCVSKVVPYESKPSSGETGPVEVSVTRLDLPGTNEKERETRPVEVSVTRLDLPGTVE